MFAFLNTYLAYITKRQDLLFASFFVLVICMMILPLPTFLVDIFLAVNLGLSLWILIVSTYLKRILDLSTFPSMLLVTTVFRLALTISTARLILAYGDAGLIIKGFGNFVVAGNVVVGLVIFIIVAIIQFIVITKGAERISEVSARFTLDAVPGKQMSIDSDFRNGEITKEEAKRKRHELERESQFFGSMDGAMRFIKGDAIASMMVVFVNLVGGLTIGMVQRKMNFHDAAQLYSLLSVGDGLIAQIPSMFLAIASGAIVTRVITDKSQDIGTDIVRQLVAEPKALGIASAFMALLSVVPGFPTTTFLILAALFGYGTWRLWRNAKKLMAQEEAAKKAEESGVVEATPSEEATPDEITPLRIAQFGDIIAIRVPTRFFDTLSALNLGGAIEQRRVNLSQRIGYQLTPIGFFRDNRDNPAIFDVDGVPVRAITIPDDPDENFVRQLADEIARLQGTNAARAFSSNDATVWLEAAKPQLGFLVEDIMKHIPVLRIVETFRLLMEENVAISQPRIIIEGLVQIAGTETNPEIIADYLRVKLARQICHSIVTANGSIAIIVVNADVEDYFKRAASNNPAKPSIDPERTEVLIANARALVSDAQEKYRGTVPAFVTQPEVRRLLRTLLTSYQINLPVMTFAELAPEFSANTIGTLTLEEGARSAA